MVVTDVSLPERRGVKAESNGSALDLRVWIFQLVSFLRFYW